MELGFTELGYFFSFFLNTYFFLKLFKCFYLFFGKLNRGKNKKWNIYSVLNLICICLENKASFCSLGAYMEGFNLFLIFFNEYGDPFRITVLIYLFIYYFFRSFWKLQGSVDREQEMLLWGITCMRQTMVVLHTDLCKYTYVHILHLLIIFHDIL